MDFVNFIKKWWPTILPGIVALWGVYGTQIQSFVTAHPAVSLVVSAGYAIFTHLMPSPAATAAK